MKKSILIIIIIGIIIVVAIGVVGRYYNYKAQETELQEFNSEFECYLDEEIYGTEIATIINKAIDNNEKYEVEKNEEELEDGNTYYSYVKNDENSISVDVKITDNDTTYTMEALYQGEIDRFVQYYNSILFKCTKIEYNSAGRVSYLLIEQITN